MKKTKYDEQKLIEAARQARKFAHARYSHFQVGAALLTKDGRIITGSNVESSSYGLTICAERVALTKALSEGIELGPCDFMPPYIEAGYGYLMHRSLVVLAVLVLIHRLVWGG